MATTPEPVSALTRWLWGTVAAICLTGAGGTLARVQDSATRISVLEARDADKSDQLRRIERKLDQVLDVLPRHRGDGG